MAGVATPPADAQRFLERASRGLFIDGEWAPPAAGGSFETRDPGTGETLATRARGRRGLDQRLQALRPGRALGWHGGVGRENGRDAPELYTEEKLIWASLN
jgi:phenylacetaldehyde dehydrogenase